MKHTVLIFKKNGIQSFNIKGDQLELRVRYVTDRWQPKYKQLAICRDGEVWNATPISEDYQDLDEDDILSAMDTVGEAENWRRVYFDGIKVWDISRLHDREIAEKISQRTDEVFHHRKLH